jgi:hypothetical protein
MTSLTRVHRVAGWQDRVRERMREAWLLVTHGPRCPACGDRMLPVPVRSPRGRDNTGRIIRYFWSCVAYPACRGTMAIVDETGHSVKGAALADAVAQARRQRDSQLTQTPAAATAEALERAERLDTFFQDAAVFAEEWRAKRLSAADVIWRVEGLCKNWLNKQARHAK